MKTKGLIVRPSSRSTYEDSLIPNLIHAARDVEAYNTRKVDTRNYVEEENAKLPLDQQVNAEDDKGYQFACRAHSIALRKFTLCYQLAKLEHGEVAIVLALANK